MYQFLRVPKDIANTVVAWMSNFTCLGDGLSKQSIRLQPFKRNWQKLKMQEKSQKSPGLKNLRDR